MNGAEFDTVFEDFIKKLVLTKTQKNRIDTALGVAQTIFDGANAEMQGSFATGTTVKPLTEHTSKDGQAGEYDADIALLSKNWSSNSVDALENTRSTLMHHYSSKVDREERNSCERVNFDSDATGVSFHTDFVPLIDTVPTQCADRKSQGWKESPTFEIIERYIEFDKRNNYSSSCLLILKRLRDYAGLGQSLPSIFLLAIHLSYYHEKESYQNDLISLCESAASVLGSGSRLTIKSFNGLHDLTENLTEKVKDKDRVLLLLEDFKSELQNMTIDTLEDMQSFLSIEFPVDKNQFPVEMQSLRANSLAFDTKNGLNKYEVLTTDHSSSSYKLITRGMEFVNPVTIKLKVKNHRQLNAGRDLEAHWRITNDPTKVPDDVRGSILSRKSGNEFIHNNETAKYDGVHRAEVFVTERQGNKVMGVGGYKVKKVASLWLHDTSF